MRRALAFLTPLGGAAGVSGDAFRWFPVVGAAVGLALGAVWWAASQVWPPLLAAGIVVSADLALTGMLHFDGLVDAADGLLPPLERERRLEAMADPAVGAFGIGAGVVVVGFRWLALAGQPVSLPLLGGLWCASRTAMAVTATVVPCARPEGLAGAFLDRRQNAMSVGATGIVLSGALVWVGRQSVGALALAAAIASAAAVVRLARLRVGGFTGDVLGAAGVIGETAGLVVGAARW